MAGPATRGSIEIGPNAKDLLPRTRLKLQPAGNMCTATTRIENAEKADPQLLLGCDSSATWPVD